MDDTVHLNLGMIPATHSNFPKKDRNSFVGIIPFPDQLSRVLLTSLTIFSGAPRTILFEKSSNVVPIH